MSQRYALNSSGTAFERVLPSALIHLSDGTLVFIHRTASGVYELAYTTDRATVTAIATLPIGTTSSTFRDAGFGPQGLALCRDDADNLFVVGGLGSASYKAAAQAFTKAAGLTWTQQALVALGGASSGGFLSVAATWCNTGGGTSGAGHLAVLLSANGGGSRFITADAGKVLTGSTVTGSSYPTNSGLFGSIVPGYSVCLSPDGFGAASGLASTNPSAGSTYPVGSWSVSSTGTATLASLGTESGTAANISSGIPAQLVRVSANLWGLVLGSGATAGSWSAARYSSMGRLTAAADAGSPSGMPLTSSPNSVQATWGAFADPTTTGKAWVITVNASTGAVARLGVGLSSGVSWDAAATSVDTVSPVVSASTNGAVVQPVSTLVDWQVYAQTASTPTYALYGDAVQFNQPPNAPTLTSPADGATIDLTSSNRFRWTFSDPDAGDSQSKFDLRYSSDGGSTWTTVTGSTPNQFVDISGGTFAAGSYEWQVRTYDALGVVGPYSSSRFFTAATPPSGLTITAPTSGEVIGASTYLVQWSAPSQDAYRVRVVGDDGSGNADATNVLYDSTKVTSSSTRSLTVPFGTNGIDAHVQVQITVSGLDSSWADVPVSVSYTPPATPTASISVVQVDGQDVALAVTATQPTPSGTQPAVSYVDIYRRQAGDPGSGARYATEQAASGTWTDWRVASGVDYEYRIRSFGTNGTQADSEWTRTSLLFPADDLFPSTSTYPK